MLTTVALFTFIGSWNDFLGPLIYLNESKFTISLGLQQFIGQYGTQWSMLMAASTVATLPIIILFFLGHKKRLFKGFPQPDSKDEPGRLTNIKNEPLSELI